MGVGMVRAIVIVGLMGALMSALIVGPRLLKSVDGSNAPVAQGTCDLMAGPCEWRTDEGQWKVALDLLPDGQYRLHVVSPLRPERFLAVLRGQSMYMGEYPVPLASQEGGHYQARFAAPVCSTGGDMVWRVDLQQGSEPVPGVPRVLTFQARSR